MADTPRGPGFWERAGVASQSRRGIALAFITAGVLFGAALRFWILSTEMGALDSDEAIVGLMARHLLHGQFSVFYYGQTYGGSHEAIIVAGLFAISAPTTLALKFVPTLLSAASALFIWRIGARTIGSFAGAVAGVLFWVWPAFFVWWSTKERGTYWAGLVLALAVFLLGLRLSEKLTTADSLGFGIALGLGWWASPQVLYYALPISIWLLIRRPSVLRKIWIILPAAVAGAVPWIVFNLKTGLATLDIPGQPDVSYTERLSGFFTHGLPGALGLRLPFSTEWLTGDAGPLTYVVLLTSLVLVAAITWWRSRSDVEVAPLALVALPYPFLFAISPFSWYVAEPRYLMFLMPALCLFVALPSGARLTPSGARLTGISRGVPVVLVIVLIATTVIGLQQMERQRLTVVTSPDVKVPSDLSQVIDVLLEKGEDRVYTDYWIAYRLSFESQERIIATPWSPVRYEPHDHVVRTSDSPSYVFISGSKLDPRFAQVLRDMNVSFERIEAGDHVVYLMSKRVLPGDISQIFV